MRDVKYSYKILSLPPNAPAPELRFSGEIEKIQGQFYCTKSYTPESYKKQITSGDCWEILSPGFDIGNIMLGFEETRVLAICWPPDYIVEFIEENENTLRIHCVPAFKYPRPGSDTIIPNDVVAELSTAFAKWYKNEMAKNGAKFAGAAEKAPPLTPSDNYVSRYSKMIKDIMSKGS